MDDVQVPTRRDWWGLATLATGLGMIVPDGTIVGVALPSIIGDLKLDLTDAQWINSLYAVILAALLLSSVSAGWCSPSSRVPISAGGRR